MSDVNPFLAPGSWYKGALHVHTTNSDGSAVPLAEHGLPSGTGAITSWPSPITM